MYRAKRGRKNMPIRWEKWKETTTKIVGKKREKTFQIVEKKKKKKWQERQLWQRNVEKEIKRTVNRHRKIKLKKVVGNCERFSLSIVSNILSFKLQMIVLLNTKYIILGTVLGYCTSLNDLKNENGFADGDFMSLLHK